MKCELCGAEYKIGNWNWKGYLFHDPEAHCPLSKYLGFQTPSVIEGVNDAIREAKKGKRDEM